MSENEIPRDNADQQAPASGKRQGEKQKPWYSEGLRFECTQCGACCSGEPGYVWVDEAEIAAMADEMNMSVESFEHKFVRDLGYDKSLVEYPDGDESEGEAANGYHVEGSPWKVLGGMNGYFSERLAFRIRGGYADTNLDAGEGYTGAVADVRMTYRFGIRSVWHLGYNLDAETAALGGFSFHRGYTSFEQSLGKLGRLHFDFSVDARRFGLYRPANTTFEGMEWPAAAKAARSSPPNKTSVRSARAGSAKA